MPNELPKNFEEFADARRAGFLKMKEVKDQGKQVCGMFCQYTPAEIIHAAGLKQVALCGRHHFTDQNGRNTASGKSLSTHQGKFWTRHGRQLSICIFFRYRCRGNYL